MNTRTGEFPIGLRMGWTAWQQDAGEFARWAASVGFSVVDTGTLEAAEAVRAAGLAVGSIDALSWSDLISDDPGARRAAIEANIELAGRAVALGCRNLFIVMLPRDPAKSRRENFALMAESVGELAPALEARGARLVVEGWPGPGALACTPEGYKALFEAVPSRGVMVNFDPSHLIRMGIDPMKFLHEIADRVGHVHGKDATVNPLALQEFGWEQPPTFVEPPAFGGGIWRYTVPGVGEFDWPRGFAVLRDSGYDGAVCVELEDADYNGTEDGEKSGFTKSLGYLVAS